MVRLIFLRKNISSTPDFFFDTRVEKQKQTKNIHSSLDRADSSSFKYLTRLTQKLSDNILIIFDFISDFCHCYAHWYWRVYGAVAGLRFEFKFNYICVSLS